MQTIFHYVLPLLPSSGNGHTAASAKTILGNFRQLGVPRLNMILTASDASSIQVARAIGRNFSSSELVVVNELVFPGNEEFDHARRKVGPASLEV